MMLSALAVLVKSSAPPHPASFVAPPPLWDRKDTEASVGCQPLASIFFQVLPAGLELRVGPSRQVTDEASVDAEAGNVAEAWFKKEKGPGGESQGKEGMSWMDLSTGWRAPR